MTRVSPDPNYDYDLTLWDTTRYTDWQKQLIGGHSNIVNIHKVHSPAEMQTPNSSPAVPIMELQLFFPVIFFR